MTIYAAPLGLSLIYLYIIGSDGRTLTYRSSYFTLGKVLESLAALGPFLSLNQHLGLTAQLLHVRECQASLSSLSLNQHLVSVDDVETFGG